MIKKLAALALALLMSLSLAACGSQKDDQAGGAVTPGVTGDAVPDMGTVSGGTYTNRFAGISCTLDDSWYFYTDEQIDELNGFVRESTSDEELKTRLESSSSAARLGSAISILKVSERLQTSSNLATQPTNTMIINKIL